MIPRRLPGFVARPLRQRLPLRLLMLAAAGWGATGCGRRDAGPADPGAAPPSHEEHVHVAPHGGTLVQLGDHAFNLEWVREPGSDLLTAYVLDAHAENFLRLPARSFSVALSGPSPGATVLTLQAVADSRTGETAGDTSRFEVRSPAVRAPGPLDCRLGEIEIRGYRYADVRFRIP